jgi:hypothetical protein
MIIEKGGEVQSKKFGGEIIIETEEKISPQIVSLFNNLLELKGLEEFLAKLPIDKIRRVTEKLKELADKIYEEIEERLKNLWPGFFEREEGRGRVETALLIVVSVILFGAIYPPFAQFLEAAGTQVYDLFHLITTSLNQFGDILEAPSNRCLLSILPLIIGGLYLAWRNSYTGRYVRGLMSGRSVEEISKEIEAILNDPSLSNVPTRTELTRDMRWAALTPFLVFLAIFSVWLPILPTIPRVLASLSNLTGFILSQIITMPAEISLELRKILEEIVKALPEIISKINEIIKSSKS